MAAVQRRAPSLEAASLTQPGKLDSIYFANERMSAYASIPSVHSSLGSKLLPEKLGQTINRVPLDRAINDIGEIQRPKSVVYSLEGYA